MTNEEMQKAMKFILKMDRQTTAKLHRLGIKVGTIPFVQNRSEKRWEQTEERIRALLARAKTTERRIAASQRTGLPLRNTPADKRLKALADLVERQISERRKEKS
jgi:hypothetical protein